MKIKIFEEGTVAECLKRLLEEGYMPATLKEIWELRKKKKIPDQWYDTGTIFLDGDIRKATIKELKGITKIYAKGGRFLFLGDYVYSRLLGDYGLYLSGRFVGVKR